LLLGGRWWHASGA